MRVQIAPSLAGSRKSRHALPCPWPDLLPSWYCWARARALAVGCGPSVQSIYEGNVRFEHCYRLDIDPHIAPTHREACWREWKQTYTYGQTRDRVEYAERRIRALASGDDRRPVLDTRPDIIKAKSSCCAERSAHSDQPSRTAPAHASRSPGRRWSARCVAGRRERGPVPPDEDCSDSCDDEWRQCSPSCEKTAERGRREATPEDRTAGADASGRRSRKPAKPAVRTTASACSVASSEAPEPPDS